LSGFHPSVFCPSGVRSKGLEEVWGWWDNTTMKLELESRQLDAKRRLIMPSDCPPNAAVTIQQVDEDTWIVKRRRSERQFKVVLIPAIHKLPDDPEWNKVENAFGRAAVRHLPPPEE
jgi:hypothetical protein